jgi:selenide,water dikinase
MRDENVLISGDTMDDAGVYRLTDELAMVQSVDFFTPMVDDPYLFGQIAAANSLSDIYAMGAVPKTAMNVTAFPVNKMSLSILEAILCGGADKLIEAGTSLLGGHTIDDEVPKYGLSVTGLVHPDKILANRGANEGDLLILTKPLGSGIISTAIKAEMASEEQTKQVSEVMRTLNKTAFDATKGLTVHACTDVTGFGLLGHAHEMVADDRIGFTIESSKVPVLEGTFELARMGLVPAGAHRNKCYLQDSLFFAEHIAVETQDILTDPQTSGGLLLAMDEIQAQNYLKQLSDLGGQGSIIGYADKRRPGKIFVR